MKKLVVFILIIELILGSILCIQLVQTHKINNYKLENEKLENNFNSYINYMQGDNNNIDYNMQLLQDVNITGIYKFDSRMAIVYYKNDKSNSKYLYIKNKADEEQMEYILNNKSNDIKADIMYNISYEVISINIKE